MYATRLPVDVCFRTGRFRPFAIAASPSLLVVLPPCSAAAASSTETSAKAVGSDSCLRSFCWPAGPKVVLVTVLRRAVEGSRALQVDCTTLVRVALLRTIAALRGACRGVSVEATVLVRPLPCDASSEDFTPFILKML